MPTARTLPRPIALSSSPVDRLRAAWEDFTRHQRARRQAAAQRALIDQLDAATRRDLGLGDPTDWGARDRSAFDPSRADPYHF